MGPLNVHADGEPQEEAGQEVTDGAALTHEQEVLGDVNADEIVPPPDGDTDGGTHNVSPCSHSAGSRSRVSPYVPRTHSSPVGGDVPSHVTDFRFGVFVTNLEKPIRLFMVLSCVPDTSPIS